MSGVEKPYHSTLITSVDAGTGKVPLFLVPSYGSHIFVFAGCLKQIAQLSLNWQDSKKSVWAVTCMRIGTVYSLLCNMLVLPPVSRPHQLRSSSPTA